MKGGLSMAEQKETLTKVLTMKFYDGSSKKDRIMSVTNPKPDLTAATVEAAMQIFVDLRPFDLIQQPEIKGASTIEKLTKDFGIVIS